MTPRQRTHLRLLREGKPLAQVAGVAGGRTVFVDDGTTVCTGAVHADDAIIMGEGGLVTNRNVHPCRSSGTIWRSCSRSAAVSGSLTVTITVPGDTNRGATVFCRNSQSLPNSRMALLHRVLWLDCGVDAGDLVAVNTLTPLAGQGKPALWCHASVTNSRAASAG